MSRTGPVPSFFPSSSTRRSRLVRFTPREAGYRPIDHWVLCIKAMKMTTSPIFSSLHPDEACWPSFQLFLLSAHSFFSPTKNALSSRLFLPVRNLPVFPPLQRARRPFVWRPTYMQTQTNCQEQSEHSLNFFLSTCFSYRKRNADPGSAHLSALLALPHRNSHPFRRRSCLQSLARTAGSSRHASQLKRRADSSMRLCVV